VNPVHLFIGTAEYNTQDKVNKDRHLWGEKHPKAKLTKDKVEEIRYMIASGLGVSEVGRMMRIPKQRISEISNYKRWKRMTD
jgi:DNA invertase Pin-like site-specific DNA recombinase